MRDQPSPASCTGCAAPGAHVVRRVAPGTLATHHCRLSCCCAALNQAAECRVQAKQDPSAASGWQSLDNFAAFSLASSLMLWRLENERRHFSIAFVRKIRRCMFDAGLTWAASSPARTERMDRAAQSFASSIFQRGRSSKCVPNMKAERRAPESKVL